MSLVLKEKVCDQNDDIEEKDQEELHQSILRGLKQASSRVGRPVAEFLADLKKRRYDECSSRDPA